MEEYNNTDSSLFRAILFSLAVAIVGSILWAVIYTYGWFVSIIAYLTAFLMLKVFNKHYPQAGGWKYAYVLIVIVILNVIASYLAIVWLVAKEANVSFEIALEAVRIVFPEYSSDFAIDMTIGTVFAVLGVISCNSTEKRKRQDAEYYNMQQERRDFDYQPQTEHVDHEQVEEVVKREAQPEVQQNVQPEVQVHVKKFCENCGTKLPEGAHNCPSCGAPVDEE